jgi:hypothetical protein
MSNSLFYRDRDENRAAQSAQLTSAVRELHQLLNQSLMQVLEATAASHSSYRPVQTAPR